MTQQIKIEPLEPEQGIQAPLEKLFLYNPDAVKKIVADMNDALGDAEQSATDAANSANVAAKSATAAATSENTAKQSATAAENAADAAKDSENAAKTSENNATASATDAANSADAAAKSAAIATESAKITQQNEETLQQYVDDAGEYATNAEQYAEEAKQATSGKADKATTLAGYGITDAYTKTQVDQKINDVQGGVDTLNTKVPSNASASNKMATAAEISNLQNQIDENALEIKGLQGAGGALTATNLGSNPTQQSITEYAIDQIWPNNTNFTWNASNPAASTFTDANGVARTAAEIFNGTWVNNTADNMRWQLTNTQNTTPAVFEWANVGQDIVGIANATTAGIIRVGDGSQMVVSPATGDISLNASKASEIRDTIGAIANNQGTANAGKFLGISNNGNVTPVDSASGAGRNIGDIFWTTRTDSSLNGAVEANGAQYNFADVNGGVNNVQTLLTSGALPSVCIEDFDAMVASVGGCDVFGYGTRGITLYPIDGYSAGNSPGDGMYYSNVYDWYTIEPDPTEDYILHGVKIYDKDTHEELVGYYVTSNPVGTGLYYYELYNANNEYVGDILSPSFSHSGEPIIAPVGELQATTYFKVPKKVGRDVQGERPMVQLFNSATDEAVATCTSVLQDVANLNVAVAGVLPIGATVQYCGDTVPDNFMWCDGSAISRTTYASLFAVIGTKYGEGDGSTTYNLPNFNSAVPWAAPDWDGWQGLQTNTNVTLPYDGYLLVTNGAQSNGITIWYSGRQLMKFTPTTTTSAENSRTMLIPFRKGQTIRVDSNNLNSVNYYKLKPTPPTEKWIIKYI